MDSSPESVGLLARAFGLLEECAGLYEADGTAICVSPKLASQLGARQGAMLRRDIADLVCTLVAKNGDDGGGWAEATMEAAAERDDALWITGLTVHVRMSGVRPAVLVFVKRAEPSRGNLEQVLRIHYGLTKKESRVCLLIARGRSTRSIAEELSISVHTVKRHTERIFAKLNAASRVEVASRVLSIEPVHPVGSRI